MSARMQLPIGNGPSYRVSDHLKSDPAGLAPTIRYSFGDNYVKINKICLQIFRVVAIRVGDFQLKTLSQNGHRFQVKGIEPPAVRNDNGNTKFSLLNLWGGIPQRTRAKLNILSGGG